MPYFKWHGITISGQEISGNQFARTLDDLRKKLLSDHIAVMDARTIKKRSSQKLKSQIAHFYRQVSLLLTSGIRLHDALLIVHSTCHHAGMQHIIQDCAQALQEGVPLSTALSFHEPLFTDFSQTMVAVGEESGNLKNALAHCADFAEYEQKFIKTLYATALMPALTFLFFLVLVIIIFIGIVPRFEALFVSYDKPLPTITAVVFAISKFLRSFRALIAILCTIVLIFGLIKLHTLQKVKYFCDRFFLALPLVGTCIRTVSLTFFLQALSVLLIGGVRLVDALALATRPIANSVIQRSLLEVLHHVTSGRSLSAALKMQPLLHIHDIEMLCEIGEASGNLAHMIQQATELYRQRVQKYVTLITTVLQPILLIILGLCICFLLVAVYMPLLTLSTVVSSM